jgi:DUF1680 family protein
MTLAIRVPGWVSAAPGLKINGRAAEISASPGSYVKIDRTWNSGDRIEMELTMQLRREPLPDDPTMQAVSFGPLLLAGQFGREGLTRELVVGPMGPQLKKLPPLVLPSLGANESVQPGDRPLTFRATRAQVTLVPFNQVSDQRYTVYWKVS